MGEAAIANPSWADFSNWLLAGALIGGCVGMVVLISLMIVEFAGWRVGNDSHFIKPGREGWSSVGIVWFCVLAGAAIAVLCYLMGMVP